MLRYSYVTRYRETPSHLVDSRLEAFLGSSNLTLRRVGILIQGKKKSGVFTYSSGGRYIGELQGGRRHGRGSFLYPDGSSYEGQWQDNVKHGELSWTPLTPHHDRFVSARIGINSILSCCCVVNCWHARKLSKRLASLMSDSSASAEETWMLKFSMML